MILQQISPTKIAAIEVERLPCFSNTDFELQYFDERTVGFFNSISQQVLKDASLRQIPAFVALAYWLRKSNIETLRKTSSEKIDNNQRIIRQPLGVVFHVCPSNVDTIFLYSLAISLLAGNKNVLRVSNRMESPALDALFAIINRTIGTEQFSMLHAYICVVAYGHDADINGYMSAHADARIMWGGDKTVQLFRALPAAPRCRDIAFPDRLSFGLLKAENILSLDESELIELCRLLYNDCYIFDQLGCSSPQVLFFVGNENDCSKAQHLIYSGLHQWAKEKYVTDLAALASLKLNQLTNDAMDEKIIDSLRDTNLLVFAQLKEIPIEPLHSCGGGYFYIKNIDHIKELSPFINKKIQTAAYYGFSEEELISLAKMAAGKGLDRIVPVGQALAFNNYWDGYHLLDQLTHLQYLWV